ncbi:hypothetical protein GE061_018400 [Apolygus lucorum]|uniref:Uncharacterized protein n=1 Tax=Apolygus lucorum TaxID=248454 RepID=A0A8S9XFT6_APOLU|nr:hypothetical protein GE061_018400 [Apolygus lucorum]
MENERKVDWIQFYKNFSLYDGLKGVDTKNVAVFRKEMTRAWSHLAQSQGLEIAIKSLRDTQLLEILLPNLVSWDDLINRLDKRSCSESITLGQVIKWFSVVQAILCVLFLFPCLWPILKKYCVCKIISKGKHKFLYVNRSPELGGQLPPTVDDIGRSICQDDAKSEQYVTSYMILHVKSVAADWLPSHIKAKVIRESKELTASKELFENLCKKLRKYEDEYQAAVRRHLEETARRRLTYEESNISKFGRWCSKALRRLLFRERQDVTTSDVRSVVTYGRKPGKRHLRRTYSAIPAQEYEKEEMINMHLLPATPQLSSSDVKESASLFNLR